MCEFVNFSIAKKLKEKGFKEKCLAYYDIDDNVGLLYNTQYGDEYSPYQYTDLLQSHNTDTTIVQPDDSENCCDAPTISQVLKWLREEKKISIEVGIHYSLKWMCGIYGFSDGLTDFTQYINDGIDDTVYILYDSYELAAIAGVEYCLDNLI